MATIKKISKKEYPTYNALCKHPFVESVLQYAVRILAGIEDIDTLLDAESKYIRPPTKAEFYCIRVGRTLSQVLSICQQLEHAILYFSSFTPTEKMKKAAITKHSHLLYCIENYIIRTHSMYDRILRLIDCVFELYNPPHIVSHELIVCNLHVQHSALPKELKALRKVIKDYYYDRNAIIHERNFLEDDIRELEAYTYIVNTDNSFKGLRNAVNTKARRIVKAKTMEFLKVNQDSFVILGSLFNNLKDEYESKREILESIHGKSELSEIPIKVKNV